MSTHPSRREFCSLAAVALSLGPLSARAQAPRFPAKAITVRVSVPAGGPADSAIRAAQPLLQRALGQPVLIENQPGANGTIATRNVLSAAPDGHTLLGGPGTDFLTAPMLVASARYNPLDFKLIGVTGVSDFVLAASAARGFREWRVQ